MHDLSRLAEVAACRLKQRSWSAEEGVRHFVDVDEIAIYEVHTWILHTVAYGHERGVASYSVSELRETPY